MYYSFEFAANTTRLCIDEIRKRGLQERKIFRKTVPNSGLFIKVFNQQKCISEDLSYVDIHSVATLMQDALWYTQDRIISKKAWRTINYETCTLSSLSTVITSKAEKLLIDILDFLVELMRYKSLNLMDAYQLGDALGKVVLGPSDCGPIISEKAGHFLTRLIIEHAKITHHHRKNKQAVMRRIDSGFDSYSSYSCHSFYTEYKPWCKTKGTQARATYYNRVISKTRRENFDWIENTVGLQSLLDNDFDVAPEPPERPWISIFTSTELLSRPDKDMNTSPTLYRILQEASKPIQDTLSDPFTASYLFDTSRIFWAESQIHEAFNEIPSHQLYTNNCLMSHETGDRANPLKKLNHSISHLKLNIKKYRSSQDLLEGSFISHDTEATMVEQQSMIMDYQSKLNNYYTNNTTRATSNTTTMNMKNMMKKMIKLGSINQQGKDRNGNYVG